MAPLSQAPSPLDASRGPAPPPVVFLHILKSGGTSLFAYGESVTGRSASRRLLESDLASYRPLPDLDGMAFLHGHLSRWHLERLSFPLRLVTVLREPTAQILSLYRFLRAMQLTPEQAAHPGAYNQLARAAQRLTLLEFLRCREPAVVGAIDNHTIRLLRRGTGENAMWQDDPLDEADLESAWDYLRGFAALATVERYDASFPLLCESLGWPVPARVPRLNDLATLERGNPGFTVQPPPAKTDAVAAELCRLTELARPLYARAAELLEQRLAKAGPTRRA